MKEFALFTNGIFQEIRQFDTKPPDIPHKAMIWAEVRRKEGPEESTRLVTESYQGQMRNYYDITTLGEEFRPVPPPEVPEIITRRQCALQLYAMQTITAQEALAMTKAGDVPAAVAAIFDAQVTNGAMTAAQRILAEIDFAAANYYRSNPLMSMMGLTPEQLDEFFIAAAQL
jgi:hypothetical protein